MVNPKAVCFNRLLRWHLCEGAFSPFAVLHSPVLRALSSRVFDFCLSSPISSSSIAGSSAVDSETEEIEPVHVDPTSGSHSSFLKQPKSGPALAVDVPSKYGGGSSKTKKSIPLRSLERYRPMEEKEFPEELPPEVVALVSRLQEKGYLKEANFSRAAPLEPEKIPANLYSRHFLKSAAEKFGQDQQETAKWLSGSHLKKVALFGCPSVEKRTVFAAKRLRAFFRIQEDVICRGCKLKSSCKFMNQRAGRQEKVILSDSMRILALLALEAVPKQLFLPSDLKSSVCILLKEVVNLSA